MTIPHPCISKLFGVWINTVPVVNNVGGQHDRRSGKVGHPKDIYNETVKISQRTMDFIGTHRNDDVRDLALHAKHDDIDLPFALNQIAGWQTARSKLPQWAAQERIIYPPHLSMEQCSSQFTAQYKSNLARRFAAALRGEGPDAPRPAAQANGAAGGADARLGTPDSHGPTPPRARERLSLADLTGGFGVDFSYLARVFDDATYVERQPHLCDIAAHNMSHLGLGHARVVNADSVEYLETMRPVTMLFLDPARRDRRGSRTYAMEDCAPNVLGLREKLLEKAQFVALKLSPMLDWRKAVADLGPCVREVHIVSHANTCRELLIVLSREDPAHPPQSARPLRGQNRLAASACSAQPGAAEPIRVYCVNDGDVFLYESQRNPAPDRLPPVHEGRLASPHALDGSQSPEKGWYLYEPNASIMKAGCFRAIEERYAVTQLERNSHLFVSRDPVTAFPGRGFVIDAVSTLSRRNLKTALHGIDRANVSSRNFPLSSERLRGRLGLRDGGERYVFGTTLGQGRHVIIVCRRCGSR
jgi:hypothetical protein